MQNFIANPRTVKMNDHVQFTYNGKTRIGTVERVGKTFLTLKHDSPANFGNKTYSSYQFKRISSRISQVAKAT